jgi:hypothetical protein
MTRRENDWWHNRDLTWWQSYMIGFLLGPIVVLLVYRSL